MSAAQGLNTLANQGGFHAKVPRSKPMTSKGHAPGVKVGKDALPEFSAQTLPVGSAPSDRTFQPSPILDQSRNSNISSEQRTAAEDSILGATSADVNKGIVRPVYGQTSRELRSEGRKARNGLAGVGADPRNAVRERALDTDFLKSPTGKGDMNRPDMVGAEDKIPEGAEAVAAERY